MHVIPFDSRLRRRPARQMPEENDSAEKTFLAHMVARNSAALKICFEIENSWFNDAIIRSGAVTPRERNIAMANEFCEQSARFMRLSNYEGRVNRMLHGHLKRLSNMRKARPAGKVA